MTVITRNRIFILARTLSFLVYALSIAIFLHYFSTGLIVQPDSEKIKPFIFQYRYNAVLISIFVFLFYTLAAQFFVYQNFVRTRATEILFFSTFLLSCISEILRLFVPIDGLASNYSAMYLLIGQGILFGRILAPLSFLFIALMSGNEQRINEEKNLTVIIFTAMFFSSIIPINSAIITKFFTFQWGYSLFIDFFRMTVVFIACFSMFLKSSKADSLEDLKIASGFAAMQAGYLILCNADSYELLSAGSLLLFAGTYIYIELLHKKYLWI